MKFTEFTFTAAKYLFKSFWQKVSRKTNHEYFRRKSK